MKRIRREVAVLTVSNWNFLKKIKHYEPIRQIPRLIVGTQASVEFKNLCTLDSSIITIIPIKNR